MCDRELFSGLLLLNEVASIKPTEKKSWAVSKWSLYQPDDHLRILQTIQRRSREGEAERSITIRQNTQAASQAMYLERYRPMYEAPPPAAEGGHRRNQSEAPVASYDCGPVPTVDASGATPGHAAVGATFANDDLA
jgi:hypothetical protein